MQHATDKHFGPLSPDEYFKMWEEMKEVLQAEQPLQQGQHFPVTPRPALHFFIREELAGTVDYDPMPSVGTCHSCAFLRTFLLMMQKRCCMPLSDRHDATEEL